MANNGIGIQGICSQYGVLTALENIDFKEGIEKKLFLESTMHRFEASESEAMFAIRRTIQYGIMYEKDGKYILTEVK